MVKKFILCLLVLFMVSPIVAQTKWDKENSFKVQNKLLELGFDPKGVDGVWGKNSQKALNQFFNIYQIEPSSEVELVLNILEGIKEDDSHLDEVMTKKDAIRFEKRIGFGSPVDRVVRYIGLTRREAIDLVIDELKNYEDDFNWPEWTYKAKSVFLLKNSNNIATRCKNINFKKSLQNSILLSLYKSSVPQFEKLFVFWLDHFSVAYDAYDMPLAYAEHLNIIRSNTNRNFLNLLRSTFSDPAMLVYLNNDNSIPKAPNENLAREFLELFSLGEGNYSEKDIKQIARMLTGYSVNEADEKFQIIDENRIRDKFTVFSKQIKTLDQLINITSSQPSFGIFIAEKMYKEYVNLKLPNRRVLHNIKIAFKKASFEIPEMLRIILSLNDFWEPENKLTLVKSPLELLIGTIHNLKYFGNSQIGNKHLDSVKNFLSNNNQDLIDPPSIEGWPTGLEWLEGQYLENRIKKTEAFFKNYLTRKEQPKFKNTIKKSYENTLEIKKYQKNLQKFFDETPYNQLAFESFVINDSSKYCNKDCNLKITLHNVKLGKKKWENISFHLSGIPYYDMVLEIFRRQSSPDLKNLKDVGISNLLNRRLLQSLKLVIDLKGHTELHNRHNTVKYLKKSLGTVGFKKIKTDDGLVDPVKIFSLRSGRVGIPTTYPFFYCGAEKYHNQILLDEYIALSLFPYNNISSNEYKAKLDKLGISLSEILLPDLDLSLQFKDYNAMITHEGYQLK